MLLSFCEALGLIEERVAGAIRALNKLRNSSAHILNYQPDIKDVACFIAAISRIYPLTVKNSSSEDHRSLEDFQQVKEHFESIELSKSLEMLFVSLRLLHVAVIGLIKPKENTDMPK